MLGKTKEENDPVIVQCPECSELNGSYVKECQHCGASIERKSDG